MSMSNFLGGNPARGRHVLEDYCNVRTGPIGGMLRSSAEPARSTYVCHHPNCKQSRSRPPSNEWHGHHLNRTTLLSPLDTSFPGQSRARLRRRHIMAHMCYCSCFCCYHAAAGPWSTPDSSFTARKVDHTVLSRSSCLRSVHPGSPKQDARTTLVLCGLARTKDCPIIRAFFQHKKHCTKEPSQCYDHCFETQPWWHCYD